MDPLLFLMSFFGPFFLWPMGYLFSLPYITEEIYKLFIVKITNGISDKSAILGGILFSASETILYSVNTELVGSLVYLAARLINTTILHVATFLIIKRLVENKIAAIAGLGLNIIIHYLYNTYVAELLKNQFLFI